MSKTFVVELTDIHQIDRASSYFDAISNFSFSETCTLSPSQHNATYQDTNLTSSSATMKEEDMDDLSPAHLVSNESFLPDPFAPAPIKQEQKPITQAEIDFENRKRAMIASLESKPSGRSKAGRDLYVDVPPPSRDLNRIPAYQRWAFVPEVPKDRKLLEARKIRREARKLRRKEPGNPWKLAKKSRLRLKKAKKERKKIDQAKIKAESSIHEDLEDKVMEERGIKAESKDEDMEDLGTMIKAEPRIKEEPGTEIFGVYDTSPGPSHVKRKPQIKQEPGVDEQSGRQIPRYSAPGCKMGLPKPFPRGVKLKHVMKPRNLNSALNLEKNEHMKEGVLVKDENLE